MAAGVTVQQDRFEDFRRAFEISARERVNDEILTPKLRLDAELPMEDISLSLLEMQELLEPYGMGNSQPVFAARTVTPVAAPTNSQGKTSAPRLSCRTPDGARHLLPRCGGGSPASTLGCRVHH